MDVLNNPQITANPADRCYHCKHSIFEAIIKVAAEDGFSVLVDGTNASDDAGARPECVPCGVVGPISSAGMWLDKG